MKNSKVSLFFAFLTLSVHIQASEIDSFTGRYETLQSLDQAQPAPVDVIDEITQKKLLAAIEQANQNGRNCDVNALHKAVRDRLSGPKFLDVEAVYGRLEGVVDMGGSEESQYPIERTVTHKNESIYQDFSVYEAPALATHVASTFAYKHPKYGKLLIGADKLGHFFGQGYSYHIMSKQKGISATLSWGDRSEKGSMGLTTTGVYSYGDLTANYEGMKFWDRLVQKAGGKGPYVLCQDGHWTSNEKMPFTWQDYLVPGMDEGLNCSTYRNASLTEKVHNRQVELEEQNPGQVYTCPVDMKQCQNIVDYATKEAKKLRMHGLPTGSEVDFIQHLVSPECRHGISKKTSERKKYQRPTRESLQQLQCQHGPFSSAITSCQNLCQHLSTLSGYFVKGMVDLISTDKSGIIKSYQNAIDQVQGDITRGLILRQESTRP